MRRQSRVWPSLGLRLLAAGVYAFVARRGLAHGGVLGIVFAAVAIPLCLYMLVVAGVVACALWQDTAPL